MRSSKESPGDLRNFKNSLTVQTDWVRSSESSKRQGSSRGGKSEPTLESKDFLPPKLLDRHQVRLNQGNRW